MVKLRTKEEIDVIVASSPVVESHKFLAQWTPERHSPEAAFGSTLDWLMRRGVQVRRIPQVWEGTLSGTQVHNKIWAQYPEHILGELGRILGIDEKITGEVIYEYMEAYLKENPAGDPSKAVGDFKKRMKEDSALSFEYGMHLLLQVFMHEGVYIVEQYTETFGRDSGIPMWCNVWARWHEEVYDVLVKQLGLEGKPIGIPEIALIFKVCLEDFGNPVAIVHSSPEKAVLRDPRCAYTELKFQDFESLRLNRQCDMAMIPCNEAQLLSYVEKAGLRPNVIAKHNRQLCQGDPSCEWTLEMVGYDRSKTYFDWRNTGLKEYEEIYRKDKVQT